LFCADADLFLNLSADRGSGATSTRAFPASVHRLGPAFTQLAIAKAEPLVRRVLSALPITCSRSANIARPLADPYRRLHVAQNWQPVTLDALEHASHGRAIRFTSVMTWQIESFADVGGKQGSGVSKFLDLPSRTSQRLSWPSTDRSVCSRTRLANSRRDGHLRSLGTIDPFIQASRRNSASPSTPTSRRVRGGSAIARRCFSRRGGPALVQDTGWPAHLPHDEGLLAFRTRSRRCRHRPPSQDYERHARRPSRNRPQHFDGGRVLPRLLDEASA